MRNDPKEPPSDVLDYIKSKFFYRDGEIDTVNNTNVGSVHKRKPNSKPYMRISFIYGGEKWKIYRSHIVWFLNMGSWPISEIDHRDRNTLNDKYENLFTVTHEEQQRNKNSYRWGFEVDKRGERSFRARSKFLRVHLGTFGSREAAYEAIDKYIEENRAKLEGML